MADNMIIAFYEMMGTLILVSTIVFTVGSGAATAVVAIPCGLYIAIIFGGHVSGAHFNPAISLAAFIGRNLGGEKVMLLIVFYWIPQFLGGILGFLIPRFFINDLIKLKGLDKFLFIIFSFGP